MLVVDASASTIFGSRRQTKQALAAELGALLAFSAITNNDKVGLVMFSDRIELALPPRKGNRHVLRVIREILSRKPAGRGTDIPAALEHLGLVTKRRCVVFLISDFLTPGWRRTLRVAARSDVVRRCEDPAGRARPSGSSSSGGRNGRPYVVDTRDWRVRDAFAAGRRRARSSATASSASGRCDHRRDRPTVPEALLRFFRMRERRA
jgi:uncharacterized protein (DUF58 family)